MLNVTGFGPDAESARESAYAGARMISFEGMQLRERHRRRRRRALARDRGLALARQLVRGVVRRRSGAELEGLSMGDVSPIATPLAEAEVRAQLEEMDVDAPRVGIVMGSKSDMETMEKAANELEERGILHELRVMSAHREPDVVADYAKNAHMRGLRVIIAGAGISAALPGAVAAHTDLPVIGVPLSGRLTAAGGLDAILSIVQMPPGVPVACVGLDNPRNAAILAAQILGA